MVNYRVCGARFETHVVLVHGLIVLKVFSEFILKVEIKCQLLSGKHFYNVSPGSKTPDYEKQKSKNNNSDVFQKCLRFFK